jgi:primosomal protein N' (replication factor Y)
VGRGHRAGRVIIQTYDPTNVTIQAAATIAANGTSGGTDEAWQLFYQTELAERQTFLFPPFVYTLKIWCRRASSKSAQSAAEKTVALLRDSGLRLSIDGPLPAFHEKAGGRYQWQAIIKAKDRQQLLAAIKLLPANWSFDIDPNNLL